MTPLPDPHAPFVLTGRIAQRVQRLPAGDAPDPAARRQAEYQAGRELAATLLAGLGARTVQVGADADRAPRWPEGFVGSISHSRHLLGVAVGRQADTRGLGIDLEAIADAEAIEAIEAVCMLPDEHGLVAAALPRADWATLVFSAKEAVYKASFPLDRQILGYEHIAVDLANAKGVTSLGRRARLSWCLAPRIVVLAIGEADAGADR